MSTSGLEAFVGNRVEAETSSVIRCCLLGVSNVPSDVIVAVEVGRAVNSTVRVVGRGEGQGSRS